MFSQLDLLSWEWIVAAIAIIQAFGRPILTDIREGNVSLFEQILIWSAFAGLLRQRYISFAIMIVLASVFSSCPLHSLVSSWSSRRGLSPNREKWMIENTGFARFGLAFCFL